MKNDPTDSPWDEISKPPTPPLKRSDAPPPPEGYEVITEGQAQPGDLYLNNTTNIWLPLPEIQEGDEIRRFYGLARKCGTAQMIIEKKIRLGRWQTGDKDTWSNR